MRRYRRLALLLGMLVALLVGGTACEGKQPAPAPQPTWLPEDEPSARIDRNATALYRDFPVTAKPRPIVLTAIALADLTHPDQVDVSGPDKKFQITGGYPKAPAKPVSVHLPDGDAQLRLADYTVMCQWDTDGVCPEGGGVPATVTLGSARFRTDRGPLELPAWVLTPSEAGHDTLAIPALPPGMFYGGDDMSAPPRPAGRVWGPATVSADGLTLRVLVPDTRNVCTGQSNPPLPVVIEDGAAIAVTSRPDRRVVGKPRNCADSQIETFITIDVHLDRPLGNRVLVDRLGFVYPVTPA